MGLRRNKTFFLGMLVSGPSWCVSACLPVTIVLIAHYVLTQLSFCPSCQRLKQAPRSSLVCLTLILRLVPECRPRRPFPSSVKRGKELDPHTILHQRSGMGTSSSPTKPGSLGRSDLGLRRSARMTWKH
jgi:hypothetical protein